MARITIAVALLWDRSGRLLCVRKRNSLYFMLPGGKIDAGETALQALVRELDEELGLMLEPSVFTPLGRFEAPAANEPGHQVVADAYLGPRVAVNGVRAELDALRWLAPASALGDETLAPLLRTRILPALIERLAAR